MRIHKLWHSSLNPELQSLCDQWFSAQPLRKEYEQRLKNNNCLFCNIRESWYWRFANEKRTDNPVA